MSFFSRCLFILHFLILNYIGSFFRAYLVFLFSVFCSPPDSSHVILPVFQFCVEAGIYVLFQIYILADKEQAKTFLADLVSKKVSKRAITSHLPMIDCIRNVSRSVCRPTAVQLL